MIGFRRAAAALQTLHADDRRWVLAGLPQHQRYAVQRYLDELGSLGFVNDDVLEEAASAAPEAPANRVPATVVERLRAADGTEVYSVLKHEPGALIAQVIAVEQWTWTADLLSLFPAARQQLIRRAIDAGVTAAPARDAFLVDALAQRLRAREHTTTRTAVLPQGVVAMAAALLARLKKSSSLPRRVQAWIR